MNNLQTLDIDHYLVLSPGRSGGQDLEGDCVPISRGRPDVVAMSELRFDLAVEYWKAHRDRAARFWITVSSVFRDYLRFGFDPARTDDTASQARRRYESLAFFQRSMSGQAWRDTITLSTAFELLLHDPSKGNTSKRIRNWITELFGGSGQAKEHAEAFGRVYKARNDIVHGGSRQTGLDLGAARRAYVEAVVRHVERQPIGPDPASSGAQR